MGKKSYRLLLVWIGQLGLGTALIALFGNHKLNDMLSADVFGNLLGRSSPLEIFSFDLINLI